MAVNLNPGADQTLVAAATRAAMANVPKDLSGTYEALASNYAATMKIVGESYGQLAKTVGKIGGQLAGQAIENMRMTGQGDSLLINKEIEIQQPKEVEVDTSKGASYTYDDGSKAPKSPYAPIDTYETTGEAPPSVLPAKPKTKTVTVTVGDELRGIRKELSSLFLKTDKKSRVRKNELRAKRDRFFGEIKAMQSDDLFNDELLASENVDYELTGNLNMAMKLGQNAYRTKSGVIKEGEFKGYKAVLTRDEDDDMAWILKDPSGNTVTGMEAGKIVTTGDTPHVVKLSEMKSMLTPKMDQGAIDTVNNEIAKMAAQGKVKGSTYLGNQLVNKFRPLLENETSLHQLTNIRMGDSETTLREELNNPSSASVEMFAGLSEAKLKSMGVTDADGDGFIGDNPNTKEIEAGDFIGSDVAVKNMQNLNSALLDKTHGLYDRSNLETVVKKHIYNTGKIMFGVGVNQRSTTTPSTPSTPKEDSSTIQSWENINLGNKSFKGNVTMKLQNDIIAQGEVTDPRDGSVYNWRGDGWYNSENKMIAKDNDTFVKNTLQIMDQRFYGLVGTGSADSGGTGISVIKDTSKKYRGGLYKFGKQTVKSSNILSSLQSFPGVELKTVSDLQGLLGKVESDPDFKQKLIDHLNKQMGSKISTRFLDDMIKDLIGNTKKKLK